MEDRAGGDPIPPGGVAGDLRRRGDDLYRAGRVAEAAEAYRRAVDLDPADADARNNLGVATADLGRPEEAVTLYREALRLRPGFADASYNLGNALAALKRPGEAEEGYRTALRLRPGFFAATINLGNLLRLAGRLDEAEALYLDASRLRPDSAMAWNNLGLVMADHGRYDEALAHYEAALRLAPSFAEARRNRGLARLAMGDWALGWPDYEWRWRCPDLVPPTIPGPAWDGSRLDGRSILLYTEQGAGDVLQFVRFASALKRLGGTVILAAPAGLHPILAGVAGVDRLVSHERLPAGLAFDVHFPLMSVPGAVGTTPETIPARAPYLAADPGRAGHWRRILDAEAPGRFRVGICWRGNPAIAYDRARSIPLMAFAPLAEIDGVRLFSLQQGPGVEELDGRVEVVDLGDRLDDSGGAFTDTAAAMLALDLVITCDSAPAHLAGALGVEAWLALPAVADWRWLRGRDDTPWYQSLRLFRQDRPGEWSTPFARMAARLRSRMAAAPGSRPIAATITPGELVDKITILLIKAERISDPSKRLNVRSELAELESTRDACVPGSTGLDELTESLLAVNKAIWDAEDAIRQFELAGDFGPGFIAVARSVYRENDRRALLKRRINDLLGWRRHEEKQHGGTTTA